MMVSVDVAIAVNGSWQKRDRVSHNGSVAVSSADTGKVVMSTASQNTAMTALYAEIKRVMVESVQGPS
jgi:hypothetical protein